MQVAKALEMRGGGFYEIVGPGQGTDDTEVTLCLAHALVHSTPPNLPLEHIAQGYALWVAASAVDVGELPVSDL